jgi:hypothetical protein
MPLAMLAVPPLERVDMGGGDMGVQGGGGFAENQFVEARFWDFVGFPRLRVGSFAV